MKVILSNLTPRNACEMCRPFLGFVFDTDIGVLPIPAHPNCDCYYQPDVDDSPVTVWSWDDMPAVTRKRWMRYTAWLIRSNQPVPALLIPLMDEAIRYNQDREDTMTNALRNYSDQPIRLNAYAPPGRVDRVEHHIYAVSAAQAVEALGHGFALDAKSLEQMAALGNQKPRGIKSRFTHPGLSANGLGKLLGRAANFYIVGNSLLCDLTLSPVAASSPHGDLRAYTEDLAEHEPDMFGMSVVIYADIVWPLADGSEVPAEDGRPDNAVTELPVARIHQLDAVDMVDEPAANRDGIFGAFSKTTSVFAAATYNTLDATLARLGIQPDQLPDLLTQYYTAPEGLPPALVQLANNALTTHSLTPAQANSFTHRYVQARLTRPFSIGGLTDMTEPSPNYQSSADNPTADQVPEQTPTPAAAPAPDLSGELAALRAELTTIRQEMDAQAEDETVQMNGRPRSRFTDVRDAGQPVLDAVNWLFGAPAANLPVPSLRNAAEIYRLLTGDNAFRGIFDPAHALAAASPTTLPNLAVNAMNKVIVGMWDTLAVYRWFEQVVTVQPTDGSLHDMDWITFGGIANLPEVADGAAYTEASLDDSKESNAFTKHGNYVGITRRMIRNSEIAKMQAVPRALAVAACRTRSAKVAAIFTANSGVGPTLDDDGVALFHSNHSNIAVTAFSFSAWAAARLECFKQTELGSSKRQGLWPKFWLGPADLYDSALDIFGYGAGHGGEPGTPNNDINPYAASRPGDPRPIPIAVPEFTDANDWAYLADPNLHPVVQMSYGQNPGGRTHPLPELFSVVGETAGLMFTNDTMPIKVRDEFAVGVSGYRGIGKRNVA